MNNAERDGQVDADKEEQKSDSLGKQDIIPPLRAPSHPSAVSQEGGKNMPTRAAEPETSPGTEQGRSEIPSFNLAEEIMAEQRRITAIRRKAPDQKEEVERQRQQADSVRDTLGQPSPQLSEQQQIIAEIVARDIERLCRGDSL